MHKRIKNIKTICLISSVFMLTGCAPGPPLPPPPMIFPGFGWIIIGLIVFLSIVLWKKIPPNEPIKIDYLTEAINAINKQLKELEKKIDELGGEQDREQDREKGKQP